jgi:hypothetical protein
MRRVLPFRRIYQGDRNVLVVSPDPRGTSHPYFPFYSMRSFLLSHHSLRITLRSERITPASDKPELFNE